MAAGPGRRGLELGGGESSLSVESWGSGRSEGWCPQSSLQPPRPPSCPPHRALTP